MLLYSGLRNKGIFTPQAGWLAWIFRTIIASTAMAATVLWLNPDAIQWSDWSLLQRLGNLLLIIMTGAATYFLLLWLQGLRPSHLKKSS
jgi:putative peptidoglycan lipid II flippase